MYDRTPALVAKVLGPIAEPTFGCALGAGPQGTRQRREAPCWVLVIIDR